MTSIQCNPIEIPKSCCKHSNKAGEVLSVTNRRTLDRCCEQHERDEDGCQLTLEPRPTVPPELYARTARKCSHPRQSPITSSSIGTASLQGMNDLHCPIQSEDVKTVFRMHPFTPRIAPSPSCLDSVDILSEGPHCFAVLKKKVPQSVATKTDLGANPVPSRLSAVCPPIVPYVAHAAHGFSATSSRTRWWVPLPVKKELLPVDKNAVAGCTVRLSQFGRLPQILVRMPTEQRVALVQGKTTLSCLAPLQTNLCDAS